jgi:hypothetical protein
MALCSVVGNTLKARPTSATFLPCSNSCCACCLISLVSLVSLLRRSRRSKNPSAPCSRYSFTYRFTVANGTPKPSATSLAFTVPASTSWLGKKRKLFTLFSSCWKTGICPWKYATLPSLHWTAMFLLISLAPAGKIGNCSWGMGILQSCSPPPPSQLSGSFHFPLSHENSRPDQDV